MTERYPSEVELKAIEDWQGTPAELIDFIGNIWAYRDASDWAIRNGRDSMSRKVFKVNFSTWGWSGNEDILGALQGTWFWMHFWWSSRRGGHYELQISPDWLHRKSPVGYGKINAIKEDAKNGTNKNQAHE